MTSKIVALNWLNNGYDITPITVSIDANGHARKSPFLSYSTDKIDETWVLANWKKTYEIGLVLNGDDYVVFDFDNMLTFGRFQQEHPAINRGVIEHSITGRGVHVYFQNTENVIQAIGLIEGLDIKASKNNFVVVDPETDLSDVDELPDDLWAFYETNKGNASKSYTVDIKGGNSTIPELNMINIGFGVEGSRNKNMSLLVWTLITLGFEKAQVIPVVKLANVKSGLSDFEIERTIDTSWRKWTNGR